MLLLLGACGSPPAPITLPAPLSPTPSTANPGRLMAGFGRVDITPPPGVGLTGYGFEGQQAAGYRQRLHARALLLRDSLDPAKQIVFLVADLGHNSPLLQRLTAQRVAAAGIAIGADRIILSTTHTHSGPGNYFEAQQLNQLAGLFGGYDPAMAEFLVSRFAAAIEYAVQDLAPARAAWGTAVVHGVTRNRSVDALLHDSESVSLLRRAEINHDSLASVAVDDTLLLLRVERCTPACAPRGAFAVFALHGTGYPEVNDLVDADIQGVTERLVERHIAGARDPGAGFFLLANGAEGDVSPDWRAESRCNDLKFRVARRPGGPRTPLGLEEWRMPNGRREACLDAARQDVATLGARLAAAVDSLFDALAVKTHPTLTLDRAFVTLDLNHLETSYPLCLPAGGTAQDAGAEDGVTRLAHWRYFWVLRSGFEEGKSGVNPNRSGCQGAKQITLGPLQRLAFGPHGFPETAELAVVQVDRTILAAVPAEITTILADRLKRAVAAAGREQIEHVAVLGFANGYVGYVTTREEYDAQNYEGGSNLYGPNTGLALTEQLQILTEGMVHGHPTVGLPPILAHPGPVAAILPRPASLTPTWFERRRVQRVWCEATRGLYGIWTDAPPGNLVPADGEVVEVQRRAADGWVNVARDDQNDVEVRALGPAGSPLYRWQVRWIPDSMPSGDYRIMPVARPRQGVPDVVNDTMHVRCPSSSSP